SQTNPSGSSQTNPSGSSQTNPQNTAPTNTAPSNTPAGSTQSNTRNLNFIISQLNPAGLPTGTPSGGNAPSRPQPGTTQPGTSTQPGVNQSGTNQPGANQPASTQPGVNQPSTPARNIQQANAIGITDRGVVEKFLSGGRRLPRIQPNALWFKTTDNPDPTRGDTYNSENPLFIQEYLPGDGQPLLVPVLQIHSPNGSPSNNLDRGNPRGYATNWLQTPQKDMTVNATFVSG
ncbi:MAG TPA: hypothetical protein DEV81_05705, partial [Cyanobacteria bacterium UBA11049]|nr:hypothetical protein [Cyanobacteria bacterium UBA11049]